MCDIRDFNLGIKTSIKRLFIMIKDINSEGAYDLT
jgi:hypothetical protein